MIIQNSYFNNNQYDKKPVTFGWKAPKLIRRMYLGADELEKISALKESYEKSHSIYTTLNGIYKKKFRELYPLISGEKIPGFVFTSGLAKDGKKLQIGNIDCTPQAKLEMLSFKLWEKDGKNFTHYRINKNGELIVLKSQDATDMRVDIPNRNALDRILEEFKQLEIFSTHFTKVREFVRQRKSSLNLSEILSELLRIDNSSGIKSEITTVNNTYKRVSKILTNKHGRDAYQLKQKFLGYEVSAKTKGLIFKNFGDNGEAYGFCPIFSKNDDRLFKLTIWDKNDKVQNVFVFFADGNVSKLKRASEDSAKGYSLIRISDAEIKKAGLSTIINNLTTKLKEFEDFLTKGKQKKEKSVKVKQPKVKKQKVKTSKTELPAAKSQKTEKVNEASNKKPVVKTEVKTKKGKTTVKAEKPSAIKTIPEKEQEPLKENIREVEIQAKPSKKLPTFSDLTLNGIGEKLTEIFSTPVEQRSSHLIHERLANGNIFNGKFSIKASDGADIVVTRVKSPKYVEFTYYSIRVTNKNGSFILNLDPDYMKILDSTKEGKPIIDKRNMVHHISKNEFLERNPEAINLPKYLGEIFETRNDTERKIVNVKTKQRIKKDIIRQKEEEIRDILAKDEDYDDFN